MNTITRCTIFSQDGVYVPHIYDEVVIYRRDRTGNPLVGVNVETPQNAQIFSDVVVLNGDNEPVQYLTQKGR